MSDAYAGFEPEGGTPLREVFLPSVQVVGDEPVEDALARLEQVMALWPRPRAGQGVRAIVVLDAMKPLASLAQVSATSSVTRNPRTRRV